MTWKSMFYSGKTYVNETLQFISGFDRNDNNILFINLKAFIYIILTHVYLSKQAESH